MSLTQTLSVASTQGTGAAEANLAAIKAHAGFVPNVFALLAAAPAALEGLCQLNSAFEASSLTPVEREVVALSTSVVNGCDYCIAGHTRFAINCGLPLAEIEAIKQQAPLRNPRLEALRRITRALIVNKGLPGERELARFAHAGFVDAQVFEVLIGIAAKMITNYASKLADLPIDDEFRIGKSEIAALPGGVKAGITR